MFCPSKDAKTEEILPGITRRTLAVGKTIILNEYTAEAGVDLPPHSHPDEHIGYVVSGALELVIGEKRRVVSKGDAYITPPDLEHSGKVLDKTVTIEVCSSKEWRIR